MGRRIRPTTKIWFSFYLIGVMSFFELNTEVVLFDLLLASSVSRSVISEAIDAASLTSVTAIPVSRDKPSYSRLRRSLLPSRSLMLMAISSAWHGLECPAKVTI